MTRAGHRVTVVGIGEEDATHDDGGVSVVTIKKFPVRPLAQFVNRRRLFSWLEDRAAAGEVGIVEVPDFQGYLPYAFEACPVVVRLHLTATIIAQRQGIRPRSIFRRFETRTLSHHRDWIGVSETILSSTTRTFGVSPHRQAVVFPPVLADRPAAVPDGLPQEYILFAGALSRRKGALDLAAAVGPLFARHPQLHIMFAGPADREAGETTDTLIRTLIDSRYLSRVHFTGRVPREQLLGLMSKARVFVFPSELEAFGLVVAEAMMMGCPTVTLNIPPFTEFIINEHHGLLVAPHDPDALSSAIERILTEPSLASRLSTAARQSISERCSEGSFVRSCTGFYRACIDKHESSRSCPSEKRHR